MRKIRFPIRHFSHSHHIPVTEYFPVGAACALTTQPPTSSRTRQIILASLKPAQKRTLRRNGKTTDIQTFKSALLSNTRKKTSKQLFKIKKAYAESPGYFLKELQSITMSNTIGIGRFRNLLMSNTIGTHKLGSTMMSKALGIHRLLSTLYLHSC